MVPDVMTSAKALGGGLPIGAIIAGPRYANVLQRGDHGSTFAGSPVIAAAALATLDVLEDEALLAHVRAWASACATGSRAFRASPQYVVRG